MVITIPSEHVLHSPWPAPSTNTQKICASHYVLVNHTLIFLIALVSYKFCYAIPPSLITIDLNNRRYVNSCLHALWYYMCCSLVSTYEQYTSNFCNVYMVANNWKPDFSPLTIISVNIVFTFMAGGPDSGPYCYQIPE